MLMPTVTTIASFPQILGAPSGSLFMDSSGNLLGAALLDGTEGKTYEIAKIGGSYATPAFLATFPSGMNKAGGNVNLSADENGDLFGLMSAGGANGFGAVVEFPNTGGGPVTLASFTGGARGSDPDATLLVDAAGNLFGTTLSGGANNAGVLFELQKTGATYATALTLLTSFSSGVAPIGQGRGNLVEDAAGDLFGVTFDSVFEVKKTGASYSAPFDFASFPANVRMGNITIDAKGDIFGTTLVGTSVANPVPSTVFEIEKTATGYAAPTAIATFTPAQGGLRGTNNFLIVDANGSVFGTLPFSTVSSGLDGLVYEIARTPDGYNSTPIPIADFRGSGDSLVSENVVADASGDLFGTTAGGGDAGSGSAFEITNSGFATTPSLTPVFSSILWQNISGQAAFWFMDGNILTGGGPVTPNPGTNFRAVGTGDFYRNGDTDILWQNTSTGQASIWLMTGTTLVGGGPVTPNPGLDWRAVATGDFFSDGPSNILWQNTNTGQASIWDMNGATLVGGGPVTPNPGTAWRAIGTGDFNKDGHSDILWQNTNTGQMSVWDMVGNTVIGGGPVTPNPGTAWQAIGTGDFNQDGFADILLQNKNTGAVSVWEMNNNTLIGGGPVANPGTSWHAIGTGADGADILLQNTSGQASVWEMNGNTIAGGGPISPSPGPTWRAVELT
jgi:uncharacterized repeat protein (TIGR03803 family)